MKQFKTIVAIQNLLPSTRGIKIALLYGSFGSNGANANSDIDIQLLVENDFKSSNFIAALKQIFQSEIQYAKEVSLRNKILVYFNSQPKVEFEIHKNLDEMKRNYLGSEITDVTKTVIYTCKDWEGRIETHLQLIVNQRNKETNTIYQKKQIAELINKFVYEFENCSAMHRRSDGYKFYFSYNIALHVAVQLYQLSRGEAKFNFLPKNFLSNILRKEDEQTFRELNGTTFLPEANKQKRKLLNFFYLAIKNLDSIERQLEIKNFLEWVYERDFLWNFRDISSNNPKIKSGIVYRTSTMSLFQEEPFFQPFLEKKKIKTVVDLRADREIIDLPYSETSLATFNYVRAPFDPWNQSIEFKNTHHHGSNVEIAYRFFGIDCKHSIKKAIEAIMDEPNATAIHCHAGKDRTGIVILLLHLLSEAELNIVYADYLASEMDTRKEHLDIVLYIINERGGITNYLLDCGLKQEQIDELKNKLLK